ncbi:MAG: TonB-dependent receptor [Pseudomonadota bacterium]
MTKKPSDSFEAEFGAEVGSFPDGQVRGVINAPILNDGLLSARLVAFGRLSDGFLDLTTIDDDNGREDYGARLSLRSQPTDRLTLDFSGSFDRSRVDAPNTATQDSVDADDPATGIDFVDPDTQDQALITASGAYEFDVGTLTSTTSFLDISLEGTDDSDFTELDILTTAIDSQDRAITQEFRFESEAFALPGRFGTISFNPGVSFSFNSSDNDFLVGTGPDFFSAVTTLGEGLGIIPPGTTVVDDGSFGAQSSEQDVNNLGIFADVRWRPIDPLEITVGARFNRDTVKVNSVSTGQGLLSTGSGLLEVPTPLGPITVPFDSPFPATFPATPFAGAEETFSAFTPNASILYDWTDDFSTYVSYSTGFRSGGFSATPSSPTGLIPFDEEKVRSFEAGFRARFLNDRLQLRGSGFYLDYDDIQVTSTTDIVGITVVDNAASARSVGSEIGLTALPIDGLRLDADWGLTFAKFTEFTDSPFGDITGADLPNAPRHTVSVIGDYEHPVDLMPVRDARAFVRAEYAFTSEFGNLVDPDALTFDSYSLVNFRVGLRSERFEVEAFVENALNNAYGTGSVSGVADFLLGDVPTSVDVGETRRFGLRARVLF